MVLLAHSIAALPAVAGAWESGTRADAPAVEVASTTEAAIESLIRDWFALLAAAPAESGPLQMLLREPTFEVALAELRSPDSHVEFVIDSIRIVPEGEGRARARFEVERRSRGADDALHIVRWDQTWWLRTPLDGALSVVRIEQRPVLPFPGTGPRIVCD